MFAHIAREKYIEPRAALEHTNPTLSQVGKSEKLDVSTASRIHVRDLKPGVNKGALHLPRILEPARVVDILVQAFCCDECAEPMLVCISQNIDAIWNPVQILERIAPGRGVIISNPVLSIIVHGGREQAGVLVSDPTTLEFPAVVGPRCFRLGCDSAGAMVKCGGCRLNTYCGKVRVWCDVPERPTDVCRDYHVLWLGVSPYGGKVCYHVRARPTTMCVMAITYCGKGIGVCTLPRTAAIGSIQAGAFSGAGMSIHSLLFKTKGESSSAK